MPKLIGSEIGSNSNLVTAVKNDIDDSYNLSQAINNFINESKRDTGNGKVLDGEIWNQVRDRLSQCLASNNSRRVNSETLCNTINYANEVLKSYVNEGPIPEDPDTDKIAGYQDRVDYHNERYEYYCNNKTKIIGYYTDMYGNEIPELDYDWDAINYHYNLWRLYTMQVKWLEKLVPTDNSVTATVSSIDLSGMTIKTS